MNGSPPHLGGGTGFQHGGQVPSIHNAGSFGGGRRNLRQSMATAARATSMRSTSSYKPTITDADDEKRRTELQRAGKHASASLIAINNDGRLNELTNSQELTDSFTAALSQLLTDIQIAGDNDTGVIIDGAVDMMVAITHASCDGYVKAIMPDMDEYINHVISILDRRLWEAERTAHTEIAESGDFITKISTLGDAAAHLATVRMADNSSMIDRLAKGEVTAAEIAALPATDAELKSTNAAKMQESIRQETITAQQLLAAADSKHGDAPFVPQSGKPKTLGESFTPGSLLLDAKNLIGKRDPVVATALVTSVTDFFNANPGTFPLCRSILKFVEKHASRTTSSWMPPTAADEFRHYFFQKPEFAAAYEFETGLLFSAIHAKFTDVTDWASPPNIHCIRSGTEHEAMLTAPTDRCDGMLIVFMMIMYHRDNLDEYNEQLRGRINGLSSRLATGNKLIVIHSFIESTLKPAIDQNIKVPWSTAIKPVISLLAAIPGSTFIDTIQQFDSPMDAETDDSIAALQQLCALLISNLENAHGVDSKQPAKRGVAFQVAGDISPGYRDGVEDNCDYAAFEIHQVAETPTFGKQNMYGKATPVSALSAGTGERGTYTKQNAICLSIQPPGRLGVWKCGVSNCNNKCVVESTTGSDGATIKGTHPVALVTMDNMQAFRTANPHGDHLFLPALCKDCHALQVEPAPGTAFKPISLKTHYNITKPVLKRRVYNNGTSNGDKGKGKGGQTKGQARMITAADDGRGSSYLSKIAGGRGGRR